MLQWTTVQCNDFIQGVDTISIIALSDLAGGSGAVNDPQMPVEHYPILKFTLFSLKESKYSKEKQMILFLKEN